MRNLLKGPLLGALILASGCTEDERVDEKTSTNEEVSKKDISVVRAEFKENLFICMKEGLEDIAGNSIGIPDSSNIKGRITEFTVSCLEEGVSTLSDNTIKKLGPLISPCYEVHGKKGETEVKYIVCESKKNGEKFEIQIQ